MKSEKEKDRRKKSIKIAQRQSLKLRYVIAAGSAVIVTLLLILYFNLSKNEVMNAKDKEAVITSDLPCDLKVEHPLIMTQQPEVRGIHYKPVREEKDFINQSN
ncbi:MAG: hypothetical protein JNL47_06390 [Bacteroidia bacterium]|nr:hypothetical protein [Bacteroidia bacterium]